MQKILLASLLISFNTFAAEEIYSISGNQSLISTASCQSRLQKKVSLGKANMYKNRVKNELKKVQNCAIASANENLITLCAQNDSNAEFVNSPAFKTTCDMKFTKYNGQDYDLITCQTTAKVECFSL